MKSKLGIILLLFCVASFFIYKNKDVKPTKTDKEKLVNGKIVDITTDKPLEGVSVAIQGNNPKSISNAQGEYAIVASSKQELVFRLNGYQTTTVEVPDAKLVKMEVVDASRIDQLKKELSESSDKE